MGQITLTKVRKAFGEAEVIPGIDLQINDGEFVVFVGPSGCGKSTLLRLIAGLEDITSGKIEIDGREATNAAPAERGLAMVFQSYALYPHMSVRKNIAFPLKMAGMSDADQTAKVENAARILNLTNYLDRRPGQLSGGQRQRVAIGRAIVREPAAFLFDEPLSNLDAALRVTMRQEITELHHNLKTTMIYVTHDQVEAMTMADKIVVMRAGKIEQIGSPDDVYDRPESKYVADFIGSPGINFLNGIVVHGEGVPAVETAAGRVPLGRHVGVKPGQQVICGLRPTDLTVHADGPITATTRLLERLGHDAQLFCETPDGGFSAIVDKSARFDEGTEVRFSIPENKIHIFDAATERRL